MAYVKYRSRDPDTTVLATFHRSPYDPGMTESPNLRPATREEIAETLSFALLYNGRKEIHDAADAMAQITAARLVRHLERCGFVLMKRPPTPHHTSTRMPGADG
jgi:hypothetical protein